MLPAASQLGIQHIEYWVSSPFSQKPTICAYLSHNDPVHIPSYPTTTRSMLLLSLHLCLYFQSRLFPLCFPTKILGTSLLPFHMPCQTHVTWTEYRIHSAATYTAFKVLFSSTIPAYDKKKLSLLHSLKSSTSIFKMALHSVKMLLRNANTFRRQVTIFRQRNKYIQNIKSKSNYLFLNSMNFRMKDRR
jgi:hypothetical protein